MKKILAIMIISMFSLNCMAVDTRSIAIQNQSPKNLDFSCLGHKVSVSSEQSGTLEFSVPTSKFVDSKFADNFLKTPPFVVIITDKANWIRKIVISSEIKNIIVTKDFNVSTN